MRLDKFLANKAVGSRKEVHELLKKGFISVNNVVIRDKAFFITPETDKVTVKGAVISAQMAYYIKFHKPAGYVTAVEDSKHPVIMDLLPPEFKSMGVFPVGRLDKDTEGLLLLTNDGVWGHRVINGKKDVLKCYQFTYEGQLASDAVARIAKGLPLEGGDVCKPGELRILSETEGQLIITEGKFHQVKRMISAVGGTITYLKRISIGSITLDEIEEPSTFVNLTDNEIAEF